MPGVEVGAGAFISAGSKAIGKMPMARLSLAIKAMS